MTAPTVVRSASAAPLAVFEHVDQPELSVVIVTYGTGLVLERCLVELAEAIRSDGLRAEVIVVDNPHPDRGTWAGDRTCLATEGVIVVRPDENLGFGGGNGTGVEMARGPLVCLLNPDAFLASGQLARLVSEAQQHPDVIVAPGFVYPDGSLQELGQRIRGDGSTVAVLEPGSPAVDYASAACWVLHREVFDALGGFDPVFHPAYYEDVDFVLRARRAGYPLVLVEDVLVVHHQRGSTTESSAEFPELSRQRAVFVERWHELVATRPMD